MSPPRSASSNEQGQGPRAGSSGLRLHDGPRATTARLLPLTMRKVRKAMPVTSIQGGLMISVLCLQVGACGDGRAPASSTCPGDGCPCADAKCTCDADATCTWVGSEATGCDAAGGSCSFSCLANNTCTGTCAGSCSADCKGDSTCDLTTGESGSLSCEGSLCTVTLGNSGSISCTDSATCHVTCTGQCSVSCGSATCDITCPGDTSPRAVAGSASCP